MTYTETIRLRAAGAEVERRDIIAAAIADIIDSWGTFEAVRATAEHGVSQADEEALWIVADQEAAAYDQSEWCDALRSALVLECRCRVAEYDRP